MRLVDMFIGLMLLCAGLWVLEEPEIVSSFILEHPVVVGVGLVLIGLVRAVIATDWEKTP